MAWKYKITKFEKTHLVYWSKDQNPYPKMHARSAIWKNHCILLCIPSISKGENHEIPHASISWVFEEEICSKYEALGQYIHGARKSVSHQCYESMDFMNQASHGFPICISVYQFSSKFCWIYLKGRDHRIGRHLVSSCVDSSSACLL